MYSNNDNDTSSDLFEIESLSKNANSFISRQESDGNSMPIEYYVIQYLEVKRMRWRIAFFGCNGFLQLGSFLGLDRLFSGDLT